MKNFPELLAPVQNWHSLKAVIGLADAVYFGVKKYNMRAKAVNFKREDLKKVVEFCHDQEPELRAYLCTNILIYDLEINDLDALLLEAKEAEIDAIIAHDIATITIAKKYDLNFHISTQANISNIETSKFYENFGAERLILARELSLDQIKIIKEGLKKAQIECFVHGSMCTSISGRCYLSATICNDANFSANRGNCVQPCRRQWKVFDEENNEFLYDGQLFLNSKDLCMIEYIPKLVEAKIDAFKIEGRMKDISYIKTVTEYYREAINDHFNGTYTEIKVKKWLDKLSKVYNRGFHTGFYFHRPTIEDVELEKRGNVSPFRKQYLGRVLSHDKRSMSVNVLIENFNTPLNIGTEIIFIGKNTYHVERVRKIIFNGKKVKNIVRKEKDDPIKINMPIKENIKKEIKNEKIYIITKT